MSYLFFDTETTGFAIFGRPPSDPAQPYIVQLAAILTNESGEELGMMDCIIHPNGWYTEIPKQASDVHGITYERASLEGISPEVAMGSFLLLYNQAENWVAHNAEFDRIMVAATAHRLKIKMAPKRPILCTMKMSTPFCKLPPTPKMIAAGRRHFKTPNLGEAYAHFHEGKKAEGKAHDALWDVRACKDVFFAIRAARNSGSTPRTP